MKNLAIKNHNIIFNRLKESIIGFLSMCDENKYTTSDNEIILPEELRDSLQELKEKEKQYEVNGMLINNLKQKIKDQQKSVKINTEKPRIKKLTNKQIEKVEKLTNKHINTIDNELEL